MKKIIFFLVLLNAPAFAQKSPYSVYMNCYTNGDTIPDDGIKTQPVTDENPVPKLFSLSLLKDGKGQQEAFIKTCQIYVYDHSGKMVPGNQNVTGAPVPDLSLILAKGNQMPSKIVMEGITISVKQADGKMLIQKLPPHTFYRAKTASKYCFPSEPISFDGKILTGDKTKEPLANQKIVLKNQKNAETRTTMTDKYGDFFFQNISLSDGYSLEIAGAGNVKDKAVFLAKTNGIVIKNFKNTGNSFTYELLPADIVSLTKEPEEDPELAVQSFKTSKNTELTIIENIYYESGSAEINAESFPKLDQIIAILKKNEELKISVSSFTDAKGDDAANLILSAKRAQAVMDYFASNGINHDRIIAIGGGETNILNRCGNGVDCSEKEHQLNRRTEFKFTK